MQTLAGSEVGCGGCVGLQETSVKRFSPENKQSAAKFNCHLDLSLKKRKEICQQTEAEANRKGSDSP